MALGTIQGNDLLSDSDDDRIDEAYAANGESIIPISPFFDPCVLFVLPPST